MAARDWEKYEREIGIFLRGKLLRWFPHLPKKSITVHSKKVYPGAKGSYEIDASAEIHLPSLTLLFLVECKHWSAAVSQDTVLALVSKLQDLGAHKGIIVTKRGFQRGAVRVARANGIALWRYDPDRRPRFHPLLMTIDWEAVARDFESKWLRRLRKLNYPAFNWSCHDNLYSSRQAPLPLWQRCKMILFSFWPLWWFLLACGAFRDRLGSIQPRDATKRVVMRFEVITAFAIGVLLPVLETYRRGISYWFVEFTTMFEDYVAGALLLIGGWASYHARPWGKTFLVLAWAYVAGLMGSSFWSQLEETLRHTASEPDNLLVVVVKSLLWGISVVALALSFKRALRARTA